MTRLGKVSCKSLFLASLLIVVLTASLFVCMFMDYSSAASLEAVVHVKNEEELKNAIANAPDGKSTTIALDNDITLILTTNDANSNGAAVNIIIQNKDITLTSNKTNGYYKLTSTTNSHTLFVGSNGILRIDGITVTHKNSNTEGCGVDVYPSGTLYLYSGTISNNPQVGVANSGIFEMSGGEISDNTQGVFNTGRFVMSGGEISDNKAEYGGGVYNYYLGTFTITGGKISSNTADYGGGVYISLGEFTMTGGEISDNKAEYGGGVYNRRDNFTMTGGKISSNTATKGGGVYNQYNFIMSGGTITHNTADKGGGVYAYGNFFDKHGGEISGNKATNGDNNVFYDSNGDGGSSGSNDNSSNANNNNNGTDSNGYSLRELVIIYVGITGIVMGVVGAVLFFASKKEVHPVEKSQ